MSKTTNFILVFLGLFMLLGLLGFGGNSDADIAVNESANADKVLHSSLADENEEVIRIPPDPEPVMVEETIYQDQVWKKKAVQWADTITKDSEALVSSLNGTDLSESKSDACQIQLLCETALEDSQKYDVSPPMQHTKAEYESGLKDYALAMEYIQSAMEASNNGDEAAFSSNLELASSFISSGEDHMQVASFIN